MIVTHHAVVRYIERIDPSLTPAEAKAAIEASAKAVDTAASIGCDRVVQGCGARLLLDADKVVTVVDKFAHKRRLHGRTTGDDA